MTGVSISGSGLLFHPVFGDLLEPRGQLLIRETEQAPHPQRRREVFIQFVLGVFGRELCTVRDERALAVPRDDDAFAFELEIRALDGNHAHADLDGELADRRNLVPRRPVAQGDAVTDLLFDLQVHRPRIGLGDLKATVHSEYTQCILCTWTSSRLSSGHLAAGWY